MMGVLLKNALKSGKMVVMPLDTACVKPELEDVKKFCLNQLSCFYPEDEPTGTCEILDLEKVIAKVKSARELSQIHSRHSEPNV